MLLAGAPVAKAKGTVRHYALGDSLPLVCLKTEDAEAISRMAETPEKLKALDLQKRQLDQMKKLHTRPINGKIRLPAR